MTDTELLELLSEMESDRVERKSSLSDPDRIREAICAFANDLPGHNKPGVIFIGAKDDGACAGTDISDELLLKLSHMRDDGNIHPFPTMEVRKKILNNCEMAVVIVHPSLAPPIRVKGRTYIRVGPRRAIATVEEEKRLSERRRTMDLPFELLPISTSSIDDLDIELFEHHYLPNAIAPDVLEKNNRSIEDKFKSLRFITPAGVPTMLGLLAAGKEPGMYIPCAYIQFLRIDGAELTDPIRSQKEIRGPLSQLLGRLDDILEANNNVSAVITTAPLEIKTSDYPLPALHQLCRNAILHRTYEGTTAPVRIYWFSDRIEIFNPGGPFGQVTKENFGQPGITDYRNSYLAEAMKVLGYAQRFGVGIQIARKELENNGNPAPEFHIESTNILVTVRKREEK